MTTPVVVQAPDPFEGVSQAFLGAFAMARQARIQSQQLAQQAADIQSQITQRGALTEESRARAEKDLYDVQQQQRAVDASEKAARFVAAHMDILGDNPAMVKALGDANVTDPLVLTGIMELRDKTLNSGILASNAVIAQANEARAKLDLAAVPLATDWLKNPTQPLPTHPTLGQAVAARLLNVTTTLDQEMENARMRAGANAQNDILARQAVIGAWHDAVQEYQLHVKDRIQAGQSDLTGIPTPLEILPKYLPFGLTTDEATAIMKDAVGKRLGKQAQPITTDPLLKYKQSPFYTKQSPDVQRHMEDAVYGRVLLNDQTPPGIRLWVEQAKKAIGRP